MFLIAKSCMCYLFTEIIISIKLIHFVQGMTILTKQSERKDKANATK